MMRTQRILTITGLSLAVLLSVAITSVQAGWHHAPVQRVSHASSGGSCGGSSGGSSGQSHGGLIQNVLSSLHQHRWQRHQVYRGHFSSGGSSGGSVYLPRMSRRLYYAPAAVVPTPAKKAKAAAEPAKKPAAKPAKKPAAKPAEKPAADAKPAVAPKEKKSAGESDQGKATFSVQVPDDARVFINNLATKTPGMNRSYVSHGLQTGFRYSYEIRAEVTRNGKLLQETQTVQLEAGQTRTLDFKVLGKPAAVVTTLILHVPQGAKVTLAGKELPDGNEIRTFQTKQLIAGETWTNYPINVTYQLNGQTKQIQRNVTLRAGNTHEIKLADGATRVVNLR